ncbi:MaoC family dehydratase [Promicromonospora soli]|uniref:MaoC-like domain-containing protein n=1 Tax=Promicromonospora soli TaxID=2035533 RepID=A0A919L0F1_9MICO|nr:MaoC family dehydratase [Promicromonospora soli]GHH78864.1 hypothetical protein GCM10017772_43190 [Promicromonospora soli]
MSDGGVGAGVSEAVSDGGVGEVIVVASPAALADAVGRTATGEWFEITQERIDAFADATEDHQWIHVDVEKAAAGPFGSTIAHGHLTLSLLPHLASSLVEVGGTAMAMNYGMDRLRFLAPVPAGSRVRARTDPLGRADADRRTSRLQGHRRARGVREAGAGRAHAVALRAGSLSFAGVQVHLGSGARRSCQCEECGAGRERSAGASDRSLVRWPRGAGARSAGFRSAWPDSVRLC